LLRFLRGLSFRAQQQVTVEAGDEDKRGRGPDRAADGRSHVGFGAHHRPTVAALKSLDGQTIKLADYKASTCC